MDLKKKIAGVGILLAGFIFLCFFAGYRDSILENGERKLIGEPDGQETVQNDAQIPQADVTAQNDAQIPWADVTAQNDAQISQADITAQNAAQILPADIAAQCEVWESRYGKETALPVEIFQDLQCYVAEGECAEALSAYRQEELICTVEELKEVCPYFETLVDEYFKTQYGENLLETNKIYRLEEADGKSCYLMFYLNSNAYLGDESYLSSMLLKEGGEGWHVSDNSSSSAGGVDDYEVFVREEAGQKVYYFLKAYGMDDSFAWLKLSRLREEFYVPVGGWTIKLIKTGVEAEILFQETENDLTVQVREYVEDNKCFLAWMQQNDMPIWGDEDEQAHYEMRGLLDSAEADTGIEQIWLIDFDGRKVTFQMKKTEDGTLALEACAHEGDDDGSLLLSCRLCFVQEAGVCGCTPAYWEAFDFNGLTMRNTENAWLRDEVQELVRKEQQQRSIAPWQGEKIISEELFELLREEAWAGFYGEENDLLESYRLDFTEDMESFMHRVAETDWGNRFGHYAKDGECKWAYRWLGEDGSENYLTCINYNYLKDSIQWWKLTEGGLEEYAYVAENREPSQLICCDGQVYYMTEAVPEYRGGGASAAVVEIGNSDNWRSLCFYITESSSGIRDFPCISLYEEKTLPPEVKEYVQEWYKEVLEACGSVGRWGYYGFSGAEEEGVLTAEGSRMLNSLSGGSRNQYVNQYYFAADIDNDGIVEYGHAELGSNGRVTFYEKENGEFRAIPFEEVFLDSDGITGSEVETVALWQLWCEKLGDTTYLFTVEELEYSPDYILRVRVLRDDYVEDKAIYLLRANMEEYCRDWYILEIRPSAEGVG